MGRQEKERADREMLRLRAQREEQPLRHEVLLDAPASGCGEKLSEGQAFRDVCGSCTPAFLALHSLQRLFSPGN